MNKNILILFSLIILSLISCSNKSKNDDPVILVTENDNEINTAINKARLAFGQFEKAFIENQETNAYSYFSIKEGFPTKDGGVEHMWVSELTYDGTNFTGVLVNDPQYDTEVQYGDTVTVDKDRISDWTYFENSSNLTYGGYTVRVFVDRMDDNEKAAFLQQSGYEFAPISE